MVVLPVTRSAAEIFIIIIILTANGFFPVAVVLQQDTTHKITHHTK
jgi:hypothetical protein